jgi:hypothetical protein
MKKLLIVSGDSFTDRNFRSGAHPEMDVSFPMWPELLAEKLDMRLINLGRSGQGNEYIYSVLQDTIENIEDKASIGLVVVGWSQCFRHDYQEGGMRMGLYKGWRAERVNPDQGDIYSWIRKSLRTYQNLVYLCERYNIPYVQTQMILLYKDYLIGLPPEDHEIAANHPVGLRPAGPLYQYPGNRKRAEKSILKLIMEYDKVLNETNFIGWPMAKALGGFNFLAECGVWPENKFKDNSPNIISKRDGHPNANGHKLIMEYIYDWLG